MALDKLGSAAGILAALRAEVSRRSERSTAKSSQEEHAPAAATRDVRVLRKQLSDIAQAVSLDDPAAVRAARPRIVRAILLWEFGAALRDHPEWQPMLESITATLERHPEQDAQFRTLLAELKR
jgi:hypothetical protein